jgi:hypothetical protein
VHRLALAGQERCVDHLCEQCVPEPVRPGVLVGYEHAVLDGLLQRLQELMLRQRDHCGEERVGDVASRGCSHSQHRAADRVEAGDALKKCIVKNSRKHLLTAGRGVEQLLGEERVPLRALVDRDRDFGWRCLGYGGHQLLDLLPIERP